MKLLTVVALLASMATIGLAARASTGPEVVVTGLENPTDLAFNPRDGSLWIVNDTAPRDTTVVVRGLGTAEQEATRFVDTSDHYLKDPTAIAFPPRFEEFATSARDGGGPTLWTSRPNEFRGARESHLDMVHLTKTALGIAAGANVADREYWVVNGPQRSIDRYFFNKPHALGGANHADGVAYRYAAGRLRPVERLPAHAEFDARTKRLYVADTGNGRVAWLATTRLRKSGRYVFNAVPERLYAVAGARVQTLARGLEQPVGLLLDGGELFVGEHATGHIVVLTLGGARLRMIDTGLGPGTLTGLAAGPDGAIYALDSRGGRVLRISR